MRKAPNPASPCGVHTVPSRTSRSEGTLAPLALTTPMRPRRRHRRHSPRLSPTHALSRTARATAAHCSFSILPRSAPAHSACRSASSPPAIGSPSTIPTHKPLSSLSPSCTLTSSSTHTRAASTGTHHHSTPLSHGLHFRRARRFPACCTCTERPQGAASASSSLAAPPPLCHVQCSKAPVV